VCLTDGALSPSKVSRKCPEIMITVQRTAGVPGRIMLLIVSMVSIDGINTVGVPWGTECSNTRLIFLDCQNNIYLVRRARISVSVFLFNPSGLFDPVWCRNSK